MSNQDKQKSEKQKSEKQKSIEVLRKQGFFFIRELGGQFVAQHGITTYYNLYVVGNVVKMGNKDKGGTNGLVY